MCYWIDSQQKLFKISSNGIMSHELKSILTSIAIVTRILTSIKKRSIFSGGS